jgi:hypothetical protein
MEISAVRERRAIVPAASLIVGPLLMSVGDLVHPAERMDAAEQMAILVDHAPGWYAAHLLLFIGIVVSIPGLFALTGLTSARRPAAGYAARVLVLMGVAAFASIFVAEMLIGRFVTDGADRATATQLLTTMFSGPMVAAVMPGVLAFFVGMGAFAIPLLIAGGKLRLIAALYSLGALLILAEIVSAQVILSQIGNVLIFCGGVVAAKRMMNDE